MKATFMGLLATITAVSKAVEIRHYPWYGCDDSHMGYSSCPEPHPMGLCCGATPNNFLGTPTLAFSTKLIGLATGDSSGSWVLGVGYVFDNGQNVGGVYGCNGNSVMTRIGHDPCAERQDADTDHTGAL